MTNILQLKVTLIATSPKVWRKILVPSEYSFFDLHVAIQEAMGWTDSHLHQFFTESPYKRNSKYKQISLPSADIWDEPDDEFIDERKAKLSQHFKSPKDTLFYEYDFGDSWMHEIKLEKILIANPKEKYPKLIDGENACPPEDCGAPPGYHHLKEVLADTENEEHEEMLEWLEIESAEEFNPTEFDLKKVKFSDPKNWLKQVEKGMGLTPIK